MLREASETEEAELLSVMLSGRQTRSISERPLLYRPGAPSR